MCRVLYICVRVCTWVCMKNVREVVCCRMFCISVCVYTWRVCKECYVLVYNRVKM